MYEIPVKIGAVPYLNGYLEMMGEEGILAGNVTIVLDFATDEAKAICEDYSAFLLCMAWSLGWDAYEVDQSGSELIRVRSLEPSTN
jgi:hypothetical protein